MDGPKPPDRESGPRDSGPRDSGPRESGPRDFQPGDRTPPDGPARRLDGVALHETPGHLLRRAQQRAVDLFVQAVGERGLRPPQFALLLAAWQNPDANQSELVRITGIDRSTAADMITRLAGRGLIRRLRTRSDGRANRLRVTAEGVAALEAAADRVARAQERIVAPIPAGQRAQFLKNLSLIADLPGPPAGPRPAGLRPARLRPEDGANRQGG